ncbi:hypothetical protein [Rhodovulum marinum]|uniref:Uncharacterized protein n=1 Tax=Rhodovulum marinum TaxID=320662 RepID=A0A4R2PSK0_9RHOB|nr:hypothetical protein [Rhodovulum marinum]TCP38074.1 hypothetical protein EV662_12218 [Rhodovulum marinum]
MDIEKPVTPGRFLLQLKTFCEKALEEAETRHDLNPQALGVILLQLSLDMTRSGGVECYHNHLHYMKNTAAEKFEELQRDFGHDLDLDDPTTGKVPKLHDTIQ